MDDQEMSGASEPVAAEIRELLGRAEAGDESVLPELRAFLDSRQDLWLHLSDLSRRAEEAVLGLLGENLLAREAVSRRLAVIKRELTTPTASPPERLLAGWVALCWLHAHVAEMDAAACRQDGEADGPRSREVQHRLDRAHRRYLAAHRQLSLATKVRPFPAADDPAIGSPG